MAERRIYSNWACTNNNNEKRKINLSIYNELMEKYKILCGCFDPSEDDIDFNDYDIVIIRSVGYHHSTYKIHKNAPCLSEMELALLCDKGNLVFGYFIEPNGDFFVFEE